MLEGASVAGDPFEPELAAAAADVAEPAGDGRDRRAAGGDLVRLTSVPRRFRFRHPIVRRAVYEADARRLADRRSRTRGAQHWRVAGPAPRRAPTTSSCRPRVGDAPAVAT